MKVTEDFKQHVLAVAKDSGIAAASRLFNISRQTIHSWRDLSDARGVTIESSDNGVISSFANGVKRYPESFKKEVVEYSQDHTIAETVEKYGVSNRSIQYWRNKYAQV